MGTGGKVRTLIYILVVGLVTLGGLPRAALCVGDHHESHVIFGHSHDHHVDGDHIPHADEEEGILCGHAIDHESCGDGGCTDLPLGNDGIALSLGAGQVSGPGPALEFADSPVILSGAMAPSTGPPQPHCQVYLGACSFLL